MTFLSISFLVFLSLLVLTAAGSLTALVNPPDWGKHPNKLLRRLDKAVDLIAPILLLIAICSTALVIVIGFALAISVLL